MKKLLCIFCLLFSAALFGQGLNLPKKTNPWRVGGGLGVGFGDNDYFAIRVSPFVGYALTSKFETGLTAGYQYSKSSYVKQNLFNVGPYVNFYPISSLFVRAHYEYYTGNTEVAMIGSGPRSYAIDESALWVGGGYRSPGRVQFFIGLMYNLLYDEKSSLFSSGLRPIAGVSVAF